MFHEFSTDTLEPHEPIAVHLSDDQLGELLEEAARQSVWRWWDKAYGGPAAEADTAVHGPE